MTKKNKTILVTGASSGIGRDLSIALMNKGYHVIGMARRKEKLNQLKSDFPNLFTPLELDVTNTKAVVASREEIKNQHQSIDVLINNAGIGLLGPLTEAPLEDWHTMADVNYKGLLSITHTYLPDLIESKGHLINIDSVAGHEVYPESVVYCSSKWAVRALSLGIEKELRGKVKVTNISPGPVETEFPDQTNHERKAKEMKDYFKNVLTAEDITRSILFAIESPDHVAINELTIRPFK